MARRGGGEGGGGVGEKEVFGWGRRRNGDVEE